MLTATLAIVGCIKLATCVSLALVGRTLLRRGASSTYALAASRAFVAWWWGIAAYMAIQGATELLASIGVATLGEIVLVRVVEVPVDAIAVWGIITYIAMLYVDTRRVAIPVAVFAVIATSLYVVEALAEPQTINVTPWGIGLAPTTPSLLYTIATSLFGVPLVLAALAYATLLFRVHEPMLRYRIGLVSVTLFSWVVGGLLATSSQGGWWNFTTITGLGIVAALAVLFAYRPPSALLARLAPDDPATRAHLRQVRERRERTAKRVSDLV
ncbi:MAG: hypothetical protein ACYDCK_10975 [Thermoplasmatota archaeon]